jgi:hypothetical protein
MTGAPTMRAPADLLAVAGLARALPPAMSAARNGALNNTVGYEQLLSIQQHQHELAMKHKEAEVAHMRACVDMLETGWPADGKQVSAALQTKDEEAALMMAAKHKELELMAGLLQLREQQIEEFRQTCESQRTSIQQLKQRCAAATQAALEAKTQPPQPLTTTTDMSVPVESPISPSTSSMQHRNDIQEDHASLQCEVNQLRSRMEELEAAVGEQHERSTGLSRALEVKSERVKALEEQLRTLHSPVGTWADSELDSGLSCGVEPSSAAGNKRPTPPRLTLPKNSTPIQRLPDRREQHGVPRNREPVGSLTGEVAVSMGPGCGTDCGLDNPGKIEILPSMPRMPPLDAGRHEDRHREARDSNYQHNHHLALAHPMPLDRGSDAAIGSQDHHRHQQQSEMWHHSQRTDVTVGRVLRRDLRGSSSTGSLHKAVGGQPLSSGCMRLSALPADEPCDVSLPSVPQTYRSAVHREWTDIPERPPAGGARVPDSPAWNNGTGGTVSEAGGETGRQSQELLREMRRLRLQMSELERVAGKRTVDPSGCDSSTGSGARRAADSRTSRHRGHAGHDRLLASASSFGGESNLDANGAYALRLEPGCDHSNGGHGSRHAPSSVHLATPLSQQFTMNGASCGTHSLPWPRHASEGNLRSSRSGASSSVAGRSVRSDEHAVPEVAAGWEYRPHASGDPVDAAVAHLVNKPGGRYRGWRALLCRLERGVYLCGTRRVRLRADAVLDRIEASDDGGKTWADLEDLMRGAEASQHALLERARDAAGLAA